MAPDATLSTIVPAEQDNFVHQVIKGRPSHRHHDRRNRSCWQSRRAALRQVLDKTLKSREYQDILEKFYGKNKFPATGGN